MATLTVSALVPAELIRKMDSASDPQSKLELLDEALQDESLKGAAQANLFFQRGLIYKLQKDYFKAIEDFDASMVISRRNYQALIEKAECLIMVDQLDQASLALDTYLLNMPGAARAYVLKGLIFEKEGSLIRAEDEFTRALNYDPHFASALEHRSRLYVREGKPRKALEDIRVWSRISPSNPDLYVFRAEVQIKLRDFESALADYARAEALRHDDQIRKQRILLFLKTDRPDMALSSAKKILDENPEDLGALVLTARSLIQLGELKRAEATLNKAIKINPKSPEASLYMGVLKGSLGNNDEALEHLNQALELDPRSSEALKERARVFVNLNDQLRAEIDLTSAADIDPSDGEIFALRGLTFFHRLLYDAAIQDFSHALEGLPNDSRTLYNRAVCYFRTDDLERALNDLNILLKNRPDAGRAYNLRGMVYGIMGKGVEALSDLDKSTSLNPSDPVVWNNRGFYKYRTGNFDGAIDDFKKALKLNPDFIFAKNNLMLATDRKMDSASLYQSFVDNQEWGERK